MKLEIIVPFKDAIEYIKDLCNDLNSQSDLDFSVCFVSDNCIDGTIDYLVGDFGFEYSVIKSEGDGPGAARNSGIKRSDADYVLFIDVDDRIDFNYVELFKKKSIETLADVIECMYTAKKIDGTIISATNLKDFLSNDSRFISLVEGKIPRLSWGKAYSRKYLIDNDAFFPDGIHNGEDHIFLLKFYQGEPSVELIIKSLYSWIRRDSSLTNRPVELKTIKDFITVSEMKTSIFSQYLLGRDDCEKLFLIFSRRLFKEARVLRNKIISDGVNSSLYIDELQCGINSSLLLNDVKNVIENDKNTTYWKDVML